uniref:Uncharacterized protein n=1 Tax=Chromera velia CCMP2878 TaxID=1169474 RepID=A0A0G4G8J8_9ALVE|eukprot:Cvel_20715.t1-p1 / transcript=Cvel_20715.t1 / gene=Cvel_20715 / organism=Chromera_velia_CCMP2878 / gene_product=hypothetical protein / transcript_product=hypothetical protein / location=Cvel_scaffold1885:34638-35596(-) / protein_length=137 / sequence_SO=supercontig / SO=protein_coding / is_pseudo=false
MDGDEDEYEEEDEDEEDGEGGELAEMQLKEFERIHGRIDDANHYNPETDEELIERQQKAAEAEARRRDTLRLRQRIPGGVLKQEEGGSGVGGFGEDLEGLGEDPLDLLMAGGGTGVDPQTAGDPEEEERFLSLFSGR